MKTCLLKFFTATAALFFLFQEGDLNAQNLDKLSSTEKVKVSGGLGFNTVTYFSSGIDFPSREPFTWFATGSLNISILDVALPFTYTYSNQGGKFTQPFNRTALNPSYKWIKSTIGLTTMSFSPYTLTGHLFLGAGVEMTPGKWKISLMGGRLNKEVEYNAQDDNSDQIVYRRFGYGIKAGYESKGYGAQLIIFKAQDNVASLPFIPLNTQIKPQDNLSVSFAGKAKLLNNLFLEAEYAFSLLTQNLYDESVPNNFFLNAVVRANSTTDFFQAYKASVKYNMKWMNIGFNYEHIDPGYKTLGGYFFNNDLDNYTLSPSFTLFNKKVTVSANTGFQKNNLAGDKSATTTRWVGSVNTSIALIKNVVISGSYSNFSVFTRNRPVSDPFYFAPADTMNFFQLTRSASAMMNWNFGKSENKNSLQLMYNFQQSTNLTGNIQDAGLFGSGVETDVTGIPMDVHMLNAAYSKQIKAWNATFTAASNINRTIAITGINTFIGPTANFRKSLFDKKSSLAIGTTYNRQYTGEALTGNVFNHRLNFTYSPKFEKENSGKFSLSANANWMQRFALISGLDDINEINFFINLNYNF